MGCGRAADTGAPRDQPANPAPALGPPGLEQRLHAWNTGRAQRLSFGRGPRRAGSQSGLRAGEATLPAQGTEASVASRGQRVTLTGRTAAAQHGACGLPPENVTPV